MIKMFDPEFNARAISARRHATGNPWFRRGTLFRGALDVLRTSKASMTVREIVNALLAAKGVTDAPAKRYRDLQTGLRASLEGNSGKTVERVGEGSPMRWRLRG